MVFRKYLKDETLDEQLRSEGYVVIPFLSADSVQRLSNEFKKAHKHGTTAFYATAHHPDTELRTRMSEAILTEFDPAVENTFKECRLLGGSFIVKTNDGNDDLQPHQDWNIVDEDSYRSFNIWVPLVDLNETNGAIEVLPKSHDWQRGYRHASIPCAYQEVHDLVWKAMKPLYMKAGEALIYDHSLLHASKANQTGLPRIAVASGIIPEEAEMFFYWNNNGVVEQYESSPEFFMSENIFAKPVGLRKLADLAYDFPQVNPERFYQLSGVEPPEPVMVEVQEDVSVAPSDQRSFWQTYTPMNILREINYRLRSR